jgi:hypothetical protein
MLSTDEMKYHDTTEKLVEILCIKTENDNALFFRVLVSYYFSVVASMMRCTVSTHDRGQIPVNMYALNLAPSGYGKGRSTGIIENQVTHLFKQRFTKETFQLLADANLPKLALKRANQKGTDPDEELISVTKEFERVGALMYSFDSATLPAVKQHRQKLLMAEAGALNLQIDEIGSNLAGSTEIFPAFLELYDVGAVKDKLIKNSNDNVRMEEVSGNTPTNLMMFGTPSTLLNGGKTEDELYSLLEGGYARRCFFSYTKEVSAPSERTPREIYDMGINPDHTKFLEELAERLDGLADMININKKLVISVDTSLLLIEYRLKCERQAAEFTQNENIKRHEMSHRYFKALKLAGTYAFIDDSPELTMDHLYSAIKMAEECGDAFNTLLTRELSHVKLAKYIASVKNDITQADMVANLPFYKGTAAAKAEMLTLAISYGYKNNIIIKRTVSDGVEFLRGESLASTDLNKMTIAYSSDITTDYRNEFAPFDQLHKLVQADGMHWVSHHLNGGYRNEENCTPGFNLVVLDVDGGTTLSTVKLLLKNYKFMVYTTKRHTDDEHRFRIILPINFTLKLDAKDFKEFMTNIYSWMPFEVDTATNQRARKWLSHEGSYEYNDGEVLDVLPFIPKTSKNEARRVLLDNQSSMDNLERWVINNIGDGNRNNMLLRYAMLLKDGGFDFNSIRSRVMSLNDKLPDKLPEMEVMSTIMKTINNKMSS